MTEIAVFGAASESFTRKNTNCSMEESIQRLKEVTETAVQKGLKVRGYISMVSVSLNISKWNVFSALPIRMKVRLIQRLLQIWQQNC